MPLTSGNISQVNRNRVNQILEVVMAYARLDFTQKTPITGTDELDAIAAGVNMLGEELETSAISLKEKEQMIKEVHHRVKNNLQIVSSLLHLQSENITDTVFLDLIVASRNRINSMALVHEMLYSSGNMQRVHVKEYIRRMGDNLHVSFSKPASNIAFNYQIKENFYLNIDHMIPVGLILNEILTNSFKYAFPDNTGTISVDVNQVNGLNTFLVSDNGIGLPHNYQQKTASLGLQLIDMLTKQLDGTLELSSHNGTRYKIEFA